MKFQVVGADRKTGEDVEIIVDARDDVAAETVANRRNIMVSSVVLVRWHPPEAQQSPEIAAKTSVRGETSPHQGERSGYATASLICGLVCLFCGGIPLGIVALVLGEVARKQIARHPGLAGQRMASAGRVLGMIGIVAGVVILALYFSLPDLSRWGPSRATTTKGILQNVVTKAEYDRIRHGMSYSEVVSIIGARGEETVSNRMEGVPGVMESIYTVMYSWQNRDGSNMNAMFQNDKLMNKAQFGLK